MTDYIQLNDGEHIHLSDVKKISRITEAERASLAKLGEHVKAEEFNTRIDHANRSKSFARETVDQIAGQGADMVQVDQNAFVPRQNITRSRNLSEKDRQQFHERTGRTMRADFKAQVDTKAGRVLATVDSPTIMRRMSQPFKGINAPTKEQVDMTKARDQAMTQAAPKQLTPTGPEHTPER